MLFGGDGEAEEGALRLGEGVEVFGAGDGLIPEELCEAVDLTTITYQHTIRMIPFYKDMRQLTVACANAALLRNALVTSSTEIFLSLSTCRSSGTP